MESSEQKTSNSIPETVVDDHSGRGWAGTIPPTKPEKFSLRSLMRGDLGFIPVVLTLAIITLYFYITTNGIFLQARNLSNLTQQIVVISILSTAAVLVLLLGEIDLSLAAVAQACAAVMATLSVYQNFNPGWRCWWHCWQAH